MADKDPQSYTPGDLGRYRPKVSGDITMRASYPQARHVWIVDNASTVLPLSSRISQWLPAIMIHRGTGVQRVDIRTANRLR